MIRKNIIIILLLLKLPILLMAQQTVRGVVIDKDSKVAIPYASIVLSDTSNTLGAVCDDLGKFRLENVPVGRRNFIVSCIGYENGYLTNIDVTVAKEVIITIELQEKYATLDEVVVEAEKDKRKAVNDFATISARSFSIEETNRYPATLGDPARQALNFAGVTGNGNDLSNEIVVRGNSPRGFLWRLEGIEIPNPNHFAYLGNSVGSVSMLSSNILSTSDFYTAAFPGEFGNVMSGVFDLSFRKGNNENTETRIALGFLGLEIAHEGPISKKQGSSYVFNYRYSTLSILNNLGIKVVGDALPNYQDFSFNVNLPTKKAGVFNIYGLGGNSWFTYAADADYGYGQIRETAEEKAQTIISGLRHIIFASKKSFFKSSLNFSMKKAEVTEQETKQDYLYKYIENTHAQAIRFTSLFNHKFNSKHTIQTGFVYSYLNDKVKNFETDEGIESVYDNFKENTYQLQYYFQWKWRLHENITMNGGLHTLYYGYTQKYSIEPRLAFKWMYRENRSFSLGMGLYSRAEDLYAYLIEKEDGYGNKTRPNSDLELSKSAHFVLGHNWNINQHTSLTIEAYYQHLYDLPSDSSEKFISINIKDVFEYQSANNVTNGGKGRNYGIEISLERFLHNNFYYLITTSLYESKFSFDNKTFYNTRYNSNFIANAIAGKDFIIDQKNAKTIGVNIKITYAGGQRYTAVDKQLSIENGEIIYSDTPYTERAKEYFRIDFGLHYKTNLKKTTHKLSLDIQNVTNRLNEFEPEYKLSDSNNGIRKQVITQNGIIPVLKYSIDF